MTVPNVNVEWVRSMMGNKKGYGRERTGGGGNNYRFASLPAQGVTKFRAFPPDSMGRIGIIVGKHYNLLTDDKYDDGKPKTLTHICVEATFPELDCICETCEMLRMFKQSGAEDDVLGHFEPSTASYIKAQMHEPVADDNGIFKKDQPVVLRMTEYSLTWLLQQTLDPDVGDFLSPTRGAIIKFERAKKDSKWERKILDSTAAGGGPLMERSEDQEKLLEAAGAIDLYKIWTMPADEELGRIHTAVEKTKNHIESQLKNVKSISSGVTGEVKDATPPNHNPATEYKSGSDNKSQEGTETRVVEKAQEQVQEKPKDQPQTQTTREESKTEVQTKVETPPTTSTTSAPKINKPSGAPECFADTTVYDSDATKCVMCFMEFECSEAVTKLKKAT